MKTTLVHLEDLRGRTDKFFERTATKECCEDCLERLQARTGIINVSKIANMTPDELTGKCEMKGCKQMLMLNVLGLNK